MSNFMVGFVCRHLTFKKRLMEYFKRKHSERESREKYLTTTYSKLMQEWLRKVEKVEASQKRKAKEAKNREFFEKVFPELRKQREDRERFNRVGARIKSEADLEEIMDGLQEQEVLSLWCMLEKTLRTELMLSLCETEVDRIISHCNLDS